jgi:hypothetical protein
MIVHIVATELNQLGCHPFQLLTSKPQQNIWKSFCESVLCTINKHTMTLNQVWRSQMNDWINYNYVNWIYLESNAYSWNEAGFVFSWPTSKYIFGFVSICLTPFNLHVYASFFCCSKSVDTKALFFSANFMSNEKGMGSHNRTPKLVILWTT